MQVITSSNLKGNKGNQKTIYVSLMRFGGKNYAILLRFASIRQGPFNTFLIAFNRG